MKLKINRSLKIALIIIIAMSICSISFLLYKELKYPVFEEEKVSLYEYNNKANINYTVFLKPNILYEEESLGEGNIYITEFIDHIKTSFNYDFSGEKEAEIKGDYEIAAVVEGYAGEGETYRTIWQKKFILLPKTSFDTKNKNFSIKEEIPLQLNVYNDFAKRVIENSRIGSQVKLTVFMDVNLKAETDNGVIDEKMMPAMVMPLNASYFEILGNLAEEKPGKIEETKKIQLPVNRKNVITFSSIIGVLIILLVLLIFVTKAIVITDSLEKNLKKIFKKHGDRLVALNNEIAVTYENHSEVKSIEDLVKIADEIGKPIIYKHSSDFKQISKFYVNDENQMYILDLNEIILELDLSNSEKSKEKSSDDVKKLREIITGLKTSKKREEKSETETTESKS